MADYSPTIINCAARVRFFIAPTGYGVFSIPEIRLAEGFFGHQAAKGISL